MSDQAKGEAAKKVKVEIISEGRVGPLLLKKGDVTDDPDYVALLDDTRDLVREYKGTKSSKEK